MDPRFSSREVNLTSSLADEIAKYVQVSRSENTRRAYLLDLAHFEAWGGAPMDYRLARAASKARQNSPASATRVSSFSELSTGRKASATAARFAMSARRKFDNRLGPLPSYGHCHINSAGL